MSPFSRGLGTQSLKQPLSSMSLSTLRRKYKGVVVVLKTPYHFRKANRKTLNTTTLPLLLSADQRFPPTRLGQERCAAGL
ncbi:hypothetical protein CGRA01v4_11338 [Colletotrichum graminicola]|nr:hypothetical protein CGRA01v4_11338 [Colletotrichum graminicola]